MLKTYHWGEETAPVVLIQPVDDHDLESMESEIRAIRGQTGAAFRLVAAAVGDWNRDLSPWPAPPAFGKEPFGGNAEATLGEILALCPADGRLCVIGGYSLAGLFALWAACRTDRFAAVAAASPSVWFPGFTGWLRETGMHSSAVYLSLGDREEKARNPVLASVGDAVRETEAILKAQGKNCVLEWNPGNHFRDGDLRTARAFAWALDALRGDRSPG